MNAEYDVCLNNIFAQAEQRMWRLSRGEDGHFTNYEFIRSATQDHQADYIRLLSAVLAQRIEQHPDEIPDGMFKTAHSLIGRRLWDLAGSLGYEGRKDSGLEERNIWGDKDEAIIYSRTERVRRAE